MNETLQWGLMGQEKDTRERKKRNTAPYIFFLIIPPFAIKKKSNWLHWLEECSTLSLSFSLHDCVFHITAFVVWQGGFPFCAPAVARVLPGYKPTNGVLTAATPLHCRRAETNRIQSVSSLSVLSASSVKNTTRH